MVFIDCLDNLPCALLGKLGQLTAAVLGIAHRLDESIPFERGHQAGHRRPLNLQSVDDLLVSHGLAFSGQKHIQNSESS